GDELVVVDDSGRVLAASLPALRDARIESRGAGIEFTIRVRRGDVLELRRARILGPAGEPVRAADGGIIGRLYPFPREPGAVPAAQGAFLPAVNRSLLLVGLGSGALAVLLALTMSRRILGPVELLTRAAHRMAAGDRTVRVALRSNDEIGDLAQAFDAMAESVAESERLRRALVSDVAHELRTPLTNLRAQLEAIEDGLVRPDGPALRSLREEVL